MGTWTGTASVPLTPDSALTVPVAYTFTQTAGGALAGTAFVPGQGTGPVSDIVRESGKIRFNVVVPQGTLRHEAALAGGSMEGTISLNGKVIARFKVLPRS